MSEQAVEQKPKTDAPIHWPGVAIDFHGDLTEAIRLPRREGVTMSYDEAISHLQRERDSQEELIEVSEIINAHHFEARGRLYEKVCQSSACAPIDSHDYLIGLEGMTAIGSAFRPSEFSESEVISAAPSLLGLRVHGKIKKKNVSTVRRWVEEVNNEIAGGASKLKGRCMELSSPRELRAFTAEEEGAKVCWPEMAQKQLQTHIFTPIQHAEACRRNKISLRRFVLIEGEPSTGKSALGSEVSKLAKSFGWTFIHANMELDQLPSAFDLAKANEPAVVFVDDIAWDESEKHRRGTLERLIGLVPKEVEILTVLTSDSDSELRQFGNDAHSVISPGKLLDAAIQLSPPDVSAITAIIQHALPNVGELNPYDVAMLAGFTASQIREFIEQAKLHAIARAGDGYFNTTFADIMDAKGDRQPTPPRVQVDGFRRGGAF